MLPISRRLSGTRSKELLLMTRGDLERLKPDRSHSPDTPFSCMSDSSQVLHKTFESTGEASDVTQWQQTHESTLRSERCAASLGEISPAPLVSTVAHPFGNAQQRGIPTSYTDTALFVRSAPQHRGFHTSSPVPYDSTSYNVTDVPDFFIKYKQHRATSADMETFERDRGQLGLMHSLTDSILSGDVTATTRRLKAKIPVEHKAAEGRVIHSSGFVVPGPGHSSTSDVARAKERERNEREDQAAQTAAVAHRVLESNFEQVDATTLPAVHKIPFEVCEPDGTVKHPSGFVPPTPAHKFRHTVNTSALRDRKVSTGRQSFRQQSPPRGVLRAMHTTSAQKASEDV